MALKGRMILRIVVVAVLIAFVAWRRFGGAHRGAESADGADTAGHADSAEHADSAGHAGSPAAQAALSAHTAAVKPAPPRHWQLGNLKLTSCELPHLLSGATTAAWCASFATAENPAQPEGRHIGLRLAVIRSDAARPAPDIVVMIAGGPGEAATQAFADTSPYAGLLKHHDVLLLDQRGTGGSNPLSCTKTASAQRNKGPNLDIFDPAEIREQVAMCLAEVQKKADPRYYTTTDAVGDLESVRRALGSPRFDLIGGSYGTRVAQQYLMRHPDAVRSVVLDSPAPNQLVLGEDFAANLEAALKRDFADCSAEPACRKAYGDPLRTLYKLRDALRANPHEVTFRDPRSFEPVVRMLTPYTLASVVRMFAYEPETVALLPLSIDAAAHGDVAPLLGQERLLDADLAGDLNSGMSMSVICSEDAGALTDRPQDSDTILGNRLIDSIKAQCEVWPHGAMPADFHAPLRSDKPVLILSGARDPVTPPRYGEEIMQGLGNARHLVLKGQGHSVLSRGCVPKLVEQFVNEPDPKKLDARCLKRLGPTPAFVDFNGASP